MNGHFKNVISSRYCVKTQSKSLVDQKCHGHALPESDVKFFAIVEGQHGHQQQYYNIRIKHEHMPE